MNDLIIKERHVNVTNIEKMQLSSKEYYKLNSSEITHWEKGMPIKEKPAIGALIWL